MLLVELLKVRLDLVRVRIEAGPLGIRLEGIGVRVGRDVTGTAWVSVFPPCAADGGIPGARNCNRQYSLLASLFCSVQG